MATTLFAAEKPVKDLVRLPSWQQNLANGRRDLPRTTGGRATDTPGYQGPNRCLYSIALIKALTISAFWKLPLNWFNFVSQKS